LIKSSIVSGRAEMNNSPYISPSDRGRPMTRESWTNKPMTSASRALSGAPAEGFLMSLPGGFLSAVNSIPRYLPREFFLFK
jgi:hypothetical protein